MGNQSHSPEKILVTGGAGFIGANFIRYLLARTGFAGIVVNYDKLTYAGNLTSLADIKEAFGGKSYFFEKGDICDYERVEEVFTKYKIDTVVHFAAESHVDRSICGPKDFIDTNINGTFTLLEAARQAWGDRDGVRFHHVSTDEVYGSLGETGYFHETTPYDPRSPYSASKAASDHIVRAYYHTYGLPVTISNCSNNYGPYQFPEKLIPLITINALKGIELPVYGDGKNVRDWLFVQDHCSGIDAVLRKGRTGETYNIGGKNEWTNIDIVRLVCELVDEFTAADAALKGRFPFEGARSDLITFVKDRPGHDRRYAIDTAKIERELKWHPETDFKDGIRKTIGWYIENEDWWGRIVSGEYMEYYEKQYPDSSAT
jgi:dTDP-glucose 4,6-dehydratase